MLEKIIPHQGEESHWNSSGKSPHHHHSSHSRDSGDDEAENQSDESVDENPHFDEGKNRGDVDGEKKPFVMLCPSQATHQGVTDDEVEILVVPDGGYAWWVLFASIIVNILIPGTVKSFGVLFIEFIEVFQASAAEAAWIPAISFFLYSSTGPFASALAIRYSDRLVTVIGGLLAATGLCLSYFATSVPFLCISYGVIGGLGSGLAYPIGVFIVARYFEKKRGLANGLCTSGSALGSVLMPPILQFLLSNYGYRKAVFINGCLLLNVCLVALFYDPVEKHLLRCKLASGEPVAKEEKVITGISSAPVPIPASGRPTFHIGHETPQGESWSPQSNEGPSPIALRLLREETLHRCRQPLSVASTPDPSSLPSATHLSKLNLSAIPEDADERAVDWNFFNGLPPAKQRLIRLSTHAHTPPTSQAQIHGGSFQDEKPLHRTSSIASNISASSFHFMSTIHHGPILTAIQYDENVNKIPDSSLPRSISASKLKRAKRQKLFDFSLLSSPFFIVVLLSCATTAVSYTNFIILLPAYAQRKGFLKTEASYLLSLVAALDFVGRIGGAALSDLQLVSRNWFFVVGVFSSGLTLTLLPLATSLAQLAGLCACFGLFSGTYIGVTAVILADKLGPHRLGSSFSISLFLNGILQLGGPPICGLLFQQLDTHDPILIGLGLFLILGSSLWLVVPFLPPEKPVPLVMANNKPIP